MLGRQARGLESRDRRRFATSARLMTSRDTCLLTGRDALAFDRRARGLTAWGLPHQRRQGRGPRDGLSIGLRYCCLDRSHSSESVGHGVLSIPVCDGKASCVAAAPGAAH